MSAMTIAVRTAPTNGPLVRVTARRNPARMSANTEKPAQRTGFRSWRAREAPLINGGSRRGDRRSLEAKSRPAKRDPARREGQ